MDLKKKIKDLERRIVLLESKGPKGTRLKEIAEWIEAQFKEDRQMMPVYRVMSRGRKMGYSEQMIQRARRQLLPHIHHTRAKGQGWLWMRLDDDR